MSTHRESIVAYIACDPPALFWSGLGDLPLEADDVLPVDMIALGGGELLSVPDFQELIGGTAERLTLMVSGVDENTVRFALEDAESVKGADVHIGIVTFDKDWQIAYVEWEKVFQARSLSISRPEAGYNENPSRTISLTIANGSTNRSRARVSFFTDADQRRRSPTDSIFSSVAMITAGTTRRFGPSE